MFWYHNVRESVLSQNLFMLPCIFLFRKIQDGRQDGRHIYDNYGCCCSIAHMNHYFYI